MSLKRPLSEELTESAKANPEVVTPVPHGQQFSPRTRSGTFLDRIQGGAEQGLEGDREVGRMAALHGLVDVACKIDGSPGHRGSPWDWLVGN